MCVPCTLGRLSSFLYRIHGYRRGFEVFLKITCCFFFCWKHHLRFFLKMCFFFFTMCFFFFFFTTSNTFLLLIVSLESIFLCFLRCLLYSQAGQSLVVNICIFLDGRVLISLDTWIILMLVCVVGLSRDVLLSRTIELSAKWGQHMNIFKYRSFIFTN